MVFHFFGDLMEMVELVPYDTDEVSYWLEVILPVVANLLYLYDIKGYEEEVEFFDPWRFDDIIVLGMTL